MKDNKVKISFAAIDPYIKENKVLPTQKEIRGQEYFAWGDDNKYPQYLYDLYNNSWYDLHSNLLEFLQSIQFHYLSFFC